MTQSEVLSLITAALVADAGVEDRVFPGVDDDLQEDALPGITVHTGTESSELLCPRPRSTLRTLPITVKVFAKDIGEEQAVQAAVDALARKVEEILSGERFGHQLLDLEFKGNAETNRTAGKVFSAAVMEFEATYYSN